MIRKYEVGEMRTSPLKRKITLSKYNNTDKRKASMRAYYIKNKEQQRDRGMRRRYGIGLDDYNKMLKEQKDSCYICKLSSSKQSKRLHIDHNHKTGKVRALLCHHCNTTIGALKENTMILKNIINYLNKYNG